MIFRDQRDALAKAASAVARAVGIPRGPNGRRWRGMTRRPQVADVVVGPPAELATFDDLVALLVEAAPDRFGARAHEVAVPVRDVDGRGSCVALKVRVAPYTVNRPDFDVRAAVSGAARLDERFATTGLDVGVLAAVDSALLVVPIVEAVDGATLDALAARLAALLVSACPTLDRRVVGRAVALVPPGTAQYIDGAVATTPAVVRRVPDPLPLADLVAVLADPARFAPEFSKWTPPALAQPVTP